MNVKEIVKKYLEENKYEGLCSYYCGCEIDDLMPCNAEGYVADCSPGYKTKCDPETCDADGDCKFHITEERPQ